MKLETFFEKFDQFADAPDAVARMRELVLSLAVQGKLVEPKPSDGDGHLLLKKLRTLLPERNSKSRSPKDITVEPETPLEIPSHWALTTVENTTRETGFFCDGDWVESKDQDPDGDVRLIQLADVGDGEYRDRSSRFMTKAAAKRLNCSYLEAGDILVARMPDPLGRCCRFPGDSKPAVTVVDVCILRPNFTFFDPDFLVIAINCPRFRRLVSAQATGTTRSRISRSNLGVLPIPLPPLAEQKRIVAKVDELMALCDRLEAQQQEREARQAALARASLARFADAPTPANLPFLFHPSYAIPPADLRKSILTLAIQGKLVPQDPNDEPIESVLAVMRSHKKFMIDSGEIRKPELQPPVSDNKAPFELPTGWQWQTWGNICDWITYGFTRPMAHVSSGPRIVTAKNVRDGYICLDETHYADPKEFAALRPKDRPRKGDLLIVKDGATIGRAAIVDFDEPFCISQTVAVLWRESCQLYGPFLLLMIRSSFTQSLIWSAAEGAAMPHLSITDFAKMPLPIPPVAEQHRIVAKVDQLMALVDALETQLAASRATGANLLSALVAELTKPR